MVTAAQLYDHVSCPRRVDLDLHGDGELRDELSAFVRMLWERGASHEAETINQLASDAVRLSGLTGDERLRATIEAMDAGASIIHGGRIMADDLLGDPDLLLRRGERYVAADIKSGRAEEAGGEDEDGRPKAHYAVQVALYTDVLERLGRSAGRFAEIWDVDGRRVEYDLDARRGPRTPTSWWDLYLATRDAVRRIAASRHSTRGALSASCGLCHWRSVCTAELEAADDLTLIPSLGRAARDSMSDLLPTVAKLARCDPEAFITGRKTAFAGVGSDRLRIFVTRARLLSTPGARAHLTAPVELPCTAHEIFFDIEADPMRDLTYLHGIVHRTNRDTARERFVAFTAEEPTPKAEREAFAATMAHFAEHPAATIYYYSKYERTAYRKLQRRYPDVCSPEDIEALFTPPRSIDLYCDIITKATEWPTRNHSIKTLAKHLGFRWRDTDPSGAASIEWYNRWIETGDRKVLQRIIDYNEDDCIATRVLLDGVRALKPA
ncbi:RecB family nuclease, putative, TM0106 family [Sphingomonas palmae]|uniref:RecB family nuclease, putative, TM0106 family n=1 Tax=Sphingomonas palmae TaxID=1855283 RepID=A0A1H7T9I1_9SPHN|nr:TM0106 family RecB-like putative nuclease [Sphingomonas palmae]SEL80896.1 RecB family nuclease, putative, TM0106 family [Sphingomonas palmae]